MEYRSSLYREVVMEYRSSQGLIWEVYVDSYDVMYLFAKVNFVLVCLQSNLKFSRKVWPKL